jgi:hypothetical protein
VQLALLPTTALVFEDSGHDFNTEGPTPVNMSGDHPPGATNTADGKLSTKTQAADNSTNVAPTVLTADNKKKPPAKDTMGETYDDDVDFLTCQLKAIQVNTDWVPKEDYYVHIDILHGSSGLVKTRLNSYMIRNDAFDPREATNFPTDLMDEAQRERDRVRPNLKLRRQLAGIGDSRYELWKVRRTFALAGFQEMVNLLPPGTSVRVVRIVDNDHEITRYNVE